MNVTYFALDLTRQLRDLSTWMFVVALPAGMYLLFGNLNDAAHSAGNANIPFYVMVSMATFAAVTATTAIAGTAAIESMLGWGRQVSLTRQPAIGFVFNKVLVALVIASGAVAVVFGLGAATNAVANSWRTWAASLGIAILGSTLFGVYGLGVAMLFRSETAVSIASAGMVFFGFLGNVFVPLSGTMLIIAKFTPMYGYVALARWPQLEGLVVNTDGSSSRDSIWLLLGNVGAWLVVFAALAVVGARKARART